MSDQIPISAKYCLQIRTRKRKTASARAYGARLLNGGRGPLHVLEPPHNTLLSDPIKFPDTHFKLWYKRAPVQ